MIVNYDHIEADRKRLNSQVSTRESQLASMLLKQALALEARIALAPPLLNTLNGSQL